ncbi:MAG TPA: hypothetical protein VM915_10830, partial [Verrucomicrobiae bacterium]|nr:hypothetical protein [Verrucomicrobiae bacterium]
MQHFINHAAIERAAAEIFSSTRARYYLYALIALATAFSAGLPLGAVWFGLALMVDELHKWASAHAGALVGDQSKALHFTLDLAQSASLAVAPGILWFEQTEIGAPLAAAMLAMLCAHTAFSARRGRLYALAICAPYAALGLIFLFGSVSFATFATTLAIGACVAYVLAAALHHAHRAAHAREQDIEWLRHHNM